MVTNVYCVHTVPRGFTDLPEWISTATPKASLCYTFNTRGNWRVSHCHHLDGTGLRLLSPVSAHGSPTPLWPHLAMCLHSSGTRDPAPPPPPLLSLREKMRASAAFTQTLLTNPVPSAVRLDQPTDVIQNLMALLSILLLMLFIPSLLPTPNSHVQYSQLKPASGPQTRCSSFGLSSFCISTSP